MNSIFERVNCCQVEEYMVLFLKKLFCGFGKVRSAQYVFLNYYKAGKKTCYTLVSLAQLSWTSLKRITAYCLPHGLIIAKFEAWGPSKKKLKLLLDYLEGRKRVKISVSYSFWAYVKRGVAEGSILGP